MLAVLDTNVIYAALRSDRGASYQILIALEQQRFQMVLGTTLLLEHEDILKRPDSQLAITHTEIGVVLDYFCSVALQQSVHWLWRPWLKDPKDDHLLELAMAASCPLIVTRNTKDFKNISLFGISVVTPAAFLNLIGGDKT